MASNLSSLPAAQIEAIRAALRGGTGQALQGGAEQGSPPYAERWHTSTQLRHIDGRARHGVRSTCRRPKAAPDTPTFEVLTWPNATRSNCARSN